MAKGLEIPFDRVTWRDGQLLTANDMQSDQTRDSRLWQLHTRYLHDTWGIAIGFAVYAETATARCRWGRVTPSTSKAGPSSHRKPWPLPCP